MFFFVGGKKKRVVNKCEKFYFQPKNIPQFAILDRRF